MSRHFTLLVLLALSASARAEDGFDGQTRQAVHDGSGGFATWGAEPLDRGAFQVGFSFDHARNPVVLQADGDFVVPIVSRATTMEVGAFYGLPFGFEAGVAIPAAVREVPNGFGVDGQDGVAANGMGDVRADIKWRALSPRGVLPGVAIVAGSTLPTGDGRGWSGAGVAQPTVTLVAEERLGPVRLLVNAGYRAYSGKGESAWDLKQGDAVLFRGAAAWMTPFRDVTIIGEALGSSTPGGGPSPLEAGIGVRAPLAKGLIASAGANVGLNDSVGTPAWRGFGAIAWSFGAGKRSRIPERRPILAASTPAPTPVATAKPVTTPAVASVKPVATPSPANPQSEALGRARVAAREGLGFYNKGDYTAALAKFQAALVSESLLLAPEKILLHKYVAYCSVALGRRSDALASFRKALALDPTIALNPATVSPKIVEVFNEAKSEHAPLAFSGAGPLVAVDQKKIVLLQPIEFGASGADIDGASLPVLDQLAKTLLEHPEIALVRIEAFTEAAGDAKKNLALSKARARAVRDYLVTKKGLAPARVLSEGYGPARPIATNQTAEGRSKNRRIEIAILTRR